MGNLILAIFILIGWWVALPIFILTHGGWIPMMLFYLVSVIAIQRRR